MPLDPVRRIGLLPVPGQQQSRPMFRTLAIAASGLTAQRQRLEAIAQNIANADVPSNPDTPGYKRRTVMMETANATNAAFNAVVPPGIGGTIANPTQPFGSPPFAVPAMEDAARSVQVSVLPLNSILGDGRPYGVAVTGIVEEEGEGTLAYEPGHPDANASGYVRYPDISTTMEMVNLADAKRVYEANATVFQVAKSMLRAAIDI